MRGPEFLSPEMHCPLDPSPREVAEAYFAYFDSTPRNDHHFWAYELTSELVEDRPSEAWEVITILLTLCTTDERLAILAAGPVEDLLCNHGPRVLPLAQALATENAHFRRCLRGVWGFNRMDPIVRGAIDTIVKDELPF